MNFDIHQHLLEYKKFFLESSFNIKSFQSIVEGQDFSYLTETSSVYSSNIEGNTLDVNSFMNAKLQKTTSKEVEEIKNLKIAYEFAQNNPLTQENFLHAHTLASKTLLIAAKQGKYRQEAVGVFGSQGLIYMAVEHEHITQYMDELFTEIYALSQKILSPEDIFYYASMIHLRFVHIHPFADGNGRVARLLEKWFLTSHLGQEFWKLQSEKHYWEHRSEYYNRINLGVNFYELDYSKALKFLMMLPESLKIK